MLGRIIQVFGLYWREIKRAPGWWPWIPGFFLVFFTGFWRTEISEYSNPVFVFVSSVFEMSSWIAMALIVLISLSGGQAEREKRQLLRLMSFPVLPVEHNLGRSLAIFLYVSTPVVLFVTLSMIFALTYYDGSPPNVWLDREQKIPEVAGSAYQFSKPSGESVWVVKPKFVASLSPGGAERSTKLLLRTPIFLPEGRRTHQYLYDMRKNPIDRHDESFSIPVNVLDRGESVIIMLDKVWLRDLSISCYRSFMNALSRELAAYFLLSVGFVALGRLVGFDTGIFMVTGAICISFMYSLLGNEAMRKLSDRYDIQKDPEAIYRLLGHRNPKWWEEVLYYHTRFLAGAEQRLMEMAPTEIFGKMERGEYVLSALSRGPMYLTAFCFIVILLFLLKTRVE